MWCICNLTLFLKYMRMHENGTQKVTCAFADKLHGLCMNNRDIIQVEIGTFERLLNYTEK